MGYNLSLGWFCHQGGRVRCAQDRTGDRLARRFGCDPSGGGHHGANEPGASLGCIGIIGLSLAAGMLYCIIILVVYCLYSRY